jgi:dihydrofolate reductase
MAFRCADLIYLTEVHAQFEGDTYFPEITRDEWEEVSREEQRSPEGIGYAFVTFQRRGKRCD